MLKAGKKLQGYFANATLQNAALRCGAAGRGCGGWVGRRPADHRTVPTPSADSETRVNTVNKCRYVDIISTLQDIQSTCCSTIYLSTKPSLFPADQDTASSAGAGWLQQLGTRMGTFRYLQSAAGCGWRHSPHSPAVITPHHSGSRHISPLATFHFKLSSVASVRTYLNHVTFRTFLCPLGSRNVYI